MVEYREHTYFVSGSIGFENAEQFREELRGAFAESDPVLDFSELCYISSSGLRVLLSLKKEVSSVQVLNVNEAVYEVLNETGFTELMTVKKKLREISVDHCELIGKGGTGTTYKIEGDMIIKVYNAGTSLDVVNAERECARSAFVLGVPTAIPFEVVKVGDCYGTLFEFINAISLGKAFQLYPERYDELIDKYVALIKKIQNIESPDGRFKNIKTILHERLESLRSLLGDERVNLLEELNDAMPDSKTLVHGDLHTGNIMLQGDELVVIDMADVTTGPKGYDFMCLCRDLCMQCQNEANKAFAEQTLSMPVELALKVWDSLSEKYLGIADEAARKQVLQGEMLACMTNSLAMSACMPAAFLEGHKDIMIGMVDSRVIPYKDVVKAVMSRL